MSIPGGTLFLLPDTLLIPQGTSFQQADILFQLQYTELVQEDKRIIQQGIWLVPAGIQLVL